MENIIEIFILGKGKNEKKKLDALNSFDKKKSTDKILCQLILIFPNYEVFNLHEIYLLASRFYLQLGKHLIALGEL